MITVMIVKGDHEHVGKVVQVGEYMLQETEEGDILHLVRTDPPLFTESGMEIMWHPSYLMKLIDTDE